MSSTGNTHCRSCEGALLVVGACLSVISLGVIVEMADPPHAPRAALPALHRVDAALPLTDLGRITTLAPSVQEAPSGNGFHQVGEDTPEIPHSAIPLDPKPCCDLFMQARIVPAFRNGQAVGFKLFAIRPGSFYSKIGLLDGDLIRKINGFDMTSPEKALEAYSRLKETTRFEVDLERDCQAIHKSYVIR